MHHFLWEFSCSGFCFQALCSRIVWGSVWYSSGATELQSWSERGELHVHVNEGKKKKKTEFKWGFFFVCLLRDAEEWKVQRHTTDFLLEFSRAFSSRNVRSERTLKEILFLLVLHILFLCFAQSRGIVLELTRTEKKKKMDPRTISKCCLHIFTKHKWNGGKPGGERGF